MEIKKNKEAILSLIAGVVTMYVGVDISAHGQLRSLIQLASERYFVGGVFMLFGLALMISGIISILKNR
jgi:hypothetical protein